jgi:hypothetical protein
MEGFPHECNRGKSATSDTGHSVDAEFSIGCGLTLFDLELAFKMLQNDIAAFDVAGGSHADSDRMAARWAETELVVKGGHSVNLGRSQVEVMGDQFDGFGRQEGKGVLNALKHGNHLVSLGRHLFQFVADFFQLGPIFFIEFALHRLPWNKECCFDW